MLTSYSELVEITSQNARNYASNTALSAYNDFVALSIQMNYVEMDRNYFSSNGGNPSNWYNQLEQLQRAVRNYNPRLVPTSIHNLEALGAYIRSFINDIMALDPSLRAPFTDHAKGQWTALHNSVKSHLDDASQTDTSTEQLLRTIQTQIVTLDANLTGIWSALVSERTHTAMVTGPPTSTRAPFKNAERSNKGHKAKRTSNSKYKRPRPTCTFCSKIGHSEDRCIVKMAQELRDQGVPQYCERCESDTHFSQTCLRKPTHSYSTVQNIERISCYHTMSDATLLDSGCSTTLITANNQVVLTDRKQYTAEVHTIFHSRTIKLRPRNSALRPDLW
jgi:hypothetical protein